MCGAGRCDWGFNWRKNFIYICDQGKLTKFNGDIYVLNKIVRKQMRLE
jgi:hypothetical protein